MSYEPEYWPEDDAGIGTDPTEKDPYTPAKPEKSISFFTFCMIIILIIIFGSSLFG